MINKRKKPKRPAKLSDLLRRVHDAVNSGNYLDMSHALQRADERKVIRPEYEWVLTNGWHEKAKDQFSERFECWNYAIRGKTVDGRMLRVVVSFDEQNMLVITVIDLDVK